MYGTAREIFFHMQPEKRTKRIPSELSDSELRNKICKNDRGVKEDCKECALLGICRYGPEIVKRHLNAVKSA